MNFKKAVRTQAKLKMLLSAPSGGGKTFSALRIAKGIGGKIAVVDTENGSASLYADMKEGPLAGLEFDVLNMSPPYTTDKYIQAWNAAVKAGYDILISDSITHQWAGEGGVLNRKEAADQRPGTNSFTNWGKFTPEQERFKSAILQLPIHMIATVRSKQDYVMSENDKGKQAPKKVGLAPVQREGMEYEFTVAFDLAMNHEAIASKDRTHMFSVDQPFLITEETGEKLKVWLETGAVPELPKAPESKPQAQPRPQNQQPKLQPQGYQMWQGAPGDFIIPVGQNKGKKISELGCDYNMRLADWLKAEYKTKNQAIPVNVKDYLFNVQAYLDEVNSPPPPVEPEPMEMDVPNFDVTPAPDKPEQKEPAYP